MDERHGRGQPGLRRPVLLRGVPIEPFLGLLRYFDDMVRELQLIEVGRSASGASARLRELALFTHHDIARDRALLERQLEAAEREGHEVADLRLDLASGSVRDARTLVDLVHALDRQSRAGDLLTPPATGEQVRLVTWLADQVEAQVAGQGAPEPFASRVG